jgi:hypothetical protein
MNGSAIGRDHRAILTFWRKVRNYTREEVELGVQADYKNGLGSDEKLQG